jgi:hypothetical protein
MKGSFGTFLIMSAAGVAVFVAAFTAGCSSDGITPVCPANTDSCVTLPGDGGLAAPDGGTK